MVGVGVSISRGLFISCLCCSLGMVFCLWFYIFSPSGKALVDKKGKRPLQTRSTKRRYNEEQSDAEEIDWESDEETDMKHKAISK